VEQIANGPGEAERPGADPATIAPLSREL